MNQEFVIPYDNCHLDNDPFCCMVCQFLYWKKNPVRFMICSSNKYPTLDKVITQRTLSEYNFQLFNDTNNWSNVNYPVAITMNDINKLRCNEKMITLIGNKITLNKQTVENNIKLINVNRLLIHYGCVNVIYDPFKNQTEELNEDYGVLFFRIIEELIGSDEINLKMSECFKKNPSKHLFAYKCLLIDYLKNKNINSYIPLYLTQILDMTNDVKNTALSVCYQIYNKMCTDEIGFERDLKTNKRIDKPFYTYNL